MEFLDLQRDLEDSMAPSETPTSVFNPQKELSQRAHAMRADVGKASADGDVFDQALRKLFAEGAVVAKSPTALVSGHTWPPGYVPTEQLLVESPQKLFERIAQRNPGTRDFVARFENFLEEYAA